MKPWIFFLAASLLCPFAAGAPACVAGMNDSAALNSCLEGELDQRSRIAEQISRRAADARSSAERRQLLDEFAEWRKSTLLACSIESQRHIDAEIREIQRKICLIERTNERIAAGSKPLP